MGRYLPGYKDGGPVRSIKNLTDFLGEDYFFKILTCDRDHGDRDTYSKIKVREWNQVGKTKVYYVPPRSFNMSTIFKLAKEVDMIYLCGCFTEYTINTLISKRLNIIKIPVVIASMGLFSPMEFQLKFKKKKLFTTVFNLMGMFKKVYWSATSELEISEIKQRIPVKDNYFIAEDLPRKVRKQQIIKEKEVGKLRVAWISRIALKKNLKGAIEILNTVKCKVEFTIYGPKHNLDYWKECEEELKKLQPNITWVWAGNVESDNVIKTLMKHHVFLFPTFGENYGHVIQEALSAGCAVILSDQTPWKDLEVAGVGYNFNVFDHSSFASAIEKYAALDSKEFQKLVARALEYAIENSNDKVNNTGYRKVFNSLAKGGGI